MSKKILMIVSSLLIVLLLFSITIPVFATDAEKLVDSFTPDTTGTAATGITNASNSVLGIIQLVGTAVAIFMLIYIGIKYVIAAPSEKADLKKTAFIYVVAAIFIFAASNILKIIGNWAGDIFGNA